MEDFLAARRELAGLAILRVRFRRDEHELGEPHVAHDARRRTKILGNLGPNENDAAVK